MLSKLPVFYFRDTVQSRADRIPERSKQSHRTLDGAQTASAFKSLNGEQLQVAFSLDCHDRDIISWVTSSKGLDAELIRDLMTDTIEERFDSVDVVPHSVQ